MVTVIGPDEKIHRGCSSLSTENQPINCHALIKFNLASKFKNYYERNLFFSCLYLLVLSFMRLSACHPYFGSLAIDHRFMSFWLFCISIRRYWWTGLRIRNELEILEIYIFLILFLLYLSRSHEIINHCFVENNNVHTTTFWFSPIRHNLNKTWAIVTLVLCHCR